MTETANAIESLRTFAVNHGEIEFAHLCTAALSGEEWALERFTEAFDGVHDVLPTARRPRADAKVLEIIRSTDCTRPDGAAPRKMSAPV